MTVTTRQRASKFLFDFSPLRDGLSVNGVPQAVSSGKLVTGTFDRGGTPNTASALDAKGRVFIPGYKTPRFTHSYDGSSLWTPRGLLLEGGRTNVALRSQEFDHATWSKTRASISANADTAPDGTTTADRMIEDATAASTHLASQNLTITADGNVALSVSAKAGSRSWCQLSLRDGPSTNYATKYFNLATGTLGSSTNAGTGAVVRASMERLAGGWYRCRVVVNIGSGVTATVWAIRLASADLTESYDGDGASYASFWGAQAEDSAGSALSYIPTTSASVARSADSLYFDFNYPSSAGALTMYAKIVDKGLLAAANSGGVCKIGTSSGTSPHFSLYSPSATQYALLHHNGTSQVSTTRTVSASRDDLVELCAILAADGSIALDYSLNGAAVSTGSYSAANAINPAGWALPRIYANIVNSITGASAFQAIRFAAGVQTLGYMRAG